MKTIIEKVSKGNGLSVEESYEVMNTIMNGEVNNIHLAALLMALKMKGESPEEIAGFVRAMRERSVKIKADKENTIDVCGTGGDNSNSFNISTAVSFVVAGAGVAVAKHGNRSVSSKTGSSDVLTELGVNVTLSPERTNEILNAIGIAFLFAPLYHPAMKHAAEVRSILGVKTIFNMLGPLTNPAGIRKQIIGTYSLQAARIMSEAATYFYPEKICFVCTDDSFDEITLSGTSDIFEVSGKDIKRYSISHEDFGLQRINPTELTGGDSKKNAEIILKVLDGKGNEAQYQTVLANASLALFVAGKVTNLKKGVELSQDSIKSGKAMEKLFLLKEY